MATAPVTPEAEQPDLLPSDLSATAGNGTFNPDAASSPKPNVNDASFDKDFRIAALYVFIILGAVGGALVLLWLWFNRRRKSRVNALILHVCISDLLVIFGACLPQLIWEYSERNWILGDAVCRLLKFLQSFVMMASNYMLVVLSIDRHQAIRAPLREPFKVIFFVIVCHFGVKQRKGSYVTGKFHLLMGGLELSFVGKSENKAVPQE